MAIHAAPDCAVYSTDIHRTKEAQKVKISEENKF